jgi:toxin HigB-1
MVIAGFGNQGTRDIYDAVNSKEARKVLPVNLWPLARRKLDMIFAAREKRDLRAPPGNRLEELKGHLTGQLSIRINDQFRIVFRFEGGNATEVAITDYH